MKHGKRFFCKLLVGVMLLGTMVLGASAAYRDQSKIQHPEAVECLTEMNVLSGNEQGYFSPRSNLTRAELCKMLCITLNGGRDPKLETTPPRTATYKDTKNHWASGYIEYCTNMGIISGFENGTFAPDAAITGEQASKMVLGSMKYDPDVFHFVGKNWTHYVNLAATKAGLYKDISCDLSAPITRDDAAQLIFNGITAPSAKYTWSEDPISGTFIKGYALTEDSIYVRYFSRLYHHNPNSLPINPVSPVIETTPTEYGSTFLDLLGKPIGDAYDLFGQPVETTSYATTASDTTYFGDVYPYFTVIYTTTREIKLIHITSPLITAFDCNYETEWTQLSEVLGKPDSTVKDDTGKDSVFVYDYENNTKQLVIKRLSDDFPVIKSIYFALSESVTP